MGSNPFTTKREGVRRLSLGVGIVGGLLLAIIVFFIAVAGGPESGTEAAGIMGVSATIGLIGSIALWSLVRIIAWVIDGFQADNSK